MKPGAAALIIVFTVMSINSAVAGGRHGQHYNSHSRAYGQHYKNHSWRRGHYYKKHYRKRGYYSYGPRRYYGHYNSHRDSAAYALGGLVIGGILGSILSNSYHSSGHSSYSAPVYINPYPVNKSVRPGYMLQENGVCYAVSYVNEGKQILSPVSPGNCE